MDLQVTRQITTVLMVTIILRRGHRTQLIAAVVVHTVEETGPTSKVLQIADFLDRQTAPHPDLTIRHSVEDIRADHSRI
jgi:hypothetical protein